MLPNLLNHGHNIEFEIPWILKRNNFKYILTRIKELLYYLLGYVFSFKLFKYCAELCDYITLLLRTSQNKKYT